jgi:ABC-type amino acid transport substrate-binding protein
MMRFAGALLILACATAASAGPGDDCGVVAHLVQADAPLTRVAAAVKKKSLTVVVSGTTSSTLPSQSGPASAYPARLEATLAKRLPGVNVRLISVAKPRQSAAEMAAAFSKVLTDEKPALVVWQTGTADAMRGIAAEEFQTTLEQAVKALQAGGADVIFVNPQYSPRTDAVVATTPYTDAMRWVASANGINLFDRQTIMRQWGELGTFDLIGATKSLDTASRVHDCIGRLLADLVLQGVAAAGDENRDKSKQ